jgi:hypothetical protein
MGLSLCCCKGHAAARAAARELTVRSKFDIFYPGNLKRRNLS